MHPYAPIAALDVGHWVNYPLIKFGSESLTVLSIAEMMLWVVAIFALNALIQRLILTRALKHTRFDQGLQFAITRIFGYAFVALGFYIALVVNGVNLSSLAVVAGALGIGIGFGLQNLVANFVAGLVILTERHVAVGDRIEVEGVAGNVTKISLRATTVVTNDNISIVVPNSELTSNPVKNWSHCGPRVRIRLPVGVAYGTDPELVRSTLLKVATESRNVLTTPSPAVFFDGFGDNALNFELAVWTDTMTHAPRRFRSELNYAIERAFREQGIEIPFPQRVVHLRRDPSETPPSESMETTEPRAASRADTPHD
jgi:small-conductance mechanosensitive channel